MSVLRLPAEFDSISLSGKRYIVTGGTSGSGLETVVFLVKHGADVVTTGRNLERGQSLLNKKIDEESRKRVTLMSLELGNLKSIELFVEDVKARWDRIDGLVNNAGGLHISNDTASMLLGDKKYDRMFIENHVGPFHLTNLLLPLLEATGTGSRIVNVSSFMHDNYQGSNGSSNLKQSSIFFDDIHYRQRKFDPMQSYGQSKLANVLHAKELASRYGTRGICAFSLHPGFMNSGFAREFSCCAAICIKSLICCLGTCMPKMSPVSDVDGAQTSLYCLLSEDALQHNGKYFSQLAMIGYSKGDDKGWPLDSQNPESADKEIASKLWTVSAELVEEMKRSETSLVATNTTA